MLHAETDNVSIPVLKTTRVLRLQFVRLSIMNQNVLVQMGTLARPLLIVGHVSFSVILRWNINYAKELLILTIFQSNIHLSFFIRISLLFYIPYFQISVKVMVKLC